MRRIETQIYLNCLCKQKMRFKVGGVGEREMESIKHWRVIGTRYVIFTYSEWFCGQLLYSDRPGWRLCCCQLEDRSLFCRRWGHPQKSRACSLQQVEGPRKDLATRRVCMSGPIDSVSIIPIHYFNIDVKLTALPRAKMVVVTVEKSFFSHKSTVWKTSISGTP